MSEVVAACISTNKGERKAPVPSVELRVSHGIVGDPHAGGCMRPKEGIYAKVLTGGPITPGATITLLTEP